MARDTLAPRLAASLALLLAGCAGDSGDWAECVTLTVTESVGAQAALGPARLGLYKGEDRAGLRGGVAGSSWKTHDNYDHLWGVYGREYFDGWADTRPPLSARKRVAVTQIVPFHDIREAPYPYGWSDSDGDVKTADCSRNAALWTRCEVALGLGYGVRLGVNPGELFDALAGLFGFDPYRDDADRRHRERLRGNTPRPASQNDPRLLPLCPTPADP